MSISYAVFCLKKKNVLATAQTGTGKTLAFLLPVIEMLLKDKTSGLAVLVLVSTFFFFNDTATTEIYTLSLHDALPISLPLLVDPRLHAGGYRRAVPGRRVGSPRRSEEHTSELQSHVNLVCRLLLE